MTEDEKLCLPLGREVLSEQYLSKPQFKPHSADSDYWYCHPESAFSRVLMSDFGAQYVCDSGWRDPRLEFVSALNSYERIPFNYEILFAHCINNLQSTLPDGEERKRYQECLSLLIGYISRLFDVRNYEFKTAKDVISNFTSSLPETTSVFTTNNDNLDELSINNDSTRDTLYDRIFLTEIDLGTGFGPNFVFPVHGNVDWFTCPMTSCERHVKPILRSAKSPLLPGQDYCPSCGHRLAVELMPPTLTKRYDLKRFYSKMIRHMYCSMVSASLIIVVGYSFSSYDTMLTSMFVKAASKRGKTIAVVDTDAEAVAGLVENLVHSCNVVVRSESLEKLLEDEILDKLIAGSTSSK